MDIKIIKVEGSFKLHPTSNSKSNLNSDCSSSASASASTTTISVNKTKPKPKAKPRPKSKKTGTKFCPLVVPPPPPNQDLLQCHLCTSASTKHVYYLDKESLDSHIKNIHPPPSFKCHVCHKVFRSSSYFDKHIITHLHAGRKKRRFKCDICFLRFNKRAQLNDHLVKIHVYKRQGQGQGQSSGQSTIQKLDLEGRNKNSKHNNSQSDSDCNTEYIEREIFNCEFCPIVCYTRSKLDLHILQTHNDRDKPFKCYLCSQSFVEQKDLSQHLQSHEGSGNGNHDMNVSGSGSAVTFKCDTEEVIEIE